MTVWPTEALSKLVAPEANALTDGPFGSKLKSEHYTTSGVRVVRLGNIGVGAFRDDDRSFVSESHAATLTKHSLAHGDLLIAALADPVGRCCAVPAAILPAIVKADCIRFRPRQDLNPKFVMHWLNSPEGRKNAERGTHGVGRLRINMDAIRALPVPVPERSVQDRTVAAIETHFSRLDAAVASLTRAKANVANARASVLKAAVEGRLVPAGWAAGRPRSHTGESAEALVRRVAAERKQRWLGAGGRGKWKDAAPPESDRLRPLPDRWTWARCEQLLCELQTGPFGSSLHASDYVEGGVPVVNPQHLQEGHIVPMGDVSVSRETAARLSAFALRAGDIVLGRRGEMGRCAVVGPREAGWILGTGSLALRLESGIDREYFAMALRSPGVVRQLEGDSVGTTMNNLNQRILLDLPVPLAPAQDQPRIVAEVERRQSVLDEVARSLDADLARCVRLRQTILKLAFEGRLVPEVSPRMEVARDIVPTAESTR